MKQDYEYQCKECGLHYKDKKTAEKCRAWCKEHKTCNIEITKEAEENKQAPEDEVGQLKKKADEYLNNWKRAEADFINYKKDEAERVSTLVKYAKEDMILNILPVLDNIELAEKQLPDKLKRGEGEARAVEWTKGFLQIQNQIKDFLKKEGVEEIKVLGKKFNPETMEAISETTDNLQLTSNIVVEEVQKGYMIDGKVLRPAKVKVSK